MIDRDNNPRFFEPSEKYLESVHTGIDEVFEGVAYEEDAWVTFRDKPWDFKDKKLDLFELINGEAHDFSLTTRSFNEGLVEYRQYRYRPKNTFSKLQVLNTLLTTEQINDDAWLEVFVRNYIQEMNDYVHTASPQEHADFLDDLESFKHRNVDS